MNSIVASDLKTPLAKEIADKREPSMRYILVIDTRPASPYCRGSGCDTISTVGNDSQTENTTPAFSKNKTTTCRLVTDLPLTEGIAPPLAAEIHLALCATGQPSIDSVHPIQRNYAISCDAGATSDAGGVRSHTSVL